MDKDLIVWCIYLVCVVINIPLLWKFKKEEFYEDGITLFDVILMLILVFTPSINLMMTIILLATCFGCYTSKIIIIKPKQNKGKTE